MTRLRLTTAFVCSLSLAPMALSANERSPIFGMATIEAISDEAAKDITARGIWADYFGGVALGYAYQSYIYTFYARYYAGSNTSTEASWYNTASYNAYYAYIYSSYAASHSAAGL